MPLLKTSTIESFIKSVSNALQNDEPVRLSGFGTFSTKVRKAREAAKALKEQQKIQEQAKQEATSSGESE